MSHPAPDPDDLLAALGRVERQAAPRDLVARIVTESARPPVVARLPLAIAACWRPIGAFLQPGVAGSAAATAAGLALGTWLALANQNSAADAIPAEPYDASALVDDTSGLAAHYLGSADSEIGQGTALPEAPPDATESDSGGAP